MVYRTLKDWNKRNKMIKPGSKATGWTHCGEGLFAQWQVQDFDRRPHIIKRVLVRVVG